MRHYTIFEASIGYGVSARPLKIHKGCETQLAKNSPTLLQKAQKEWATQHRLCGSGAATRGGRMRGDQLTVPNRYDVKCEHEDSSAA